MVIDGNPVHIDYRFDPENESGFFPDRTIADTDPKIDSEFTPLPELCPGTTNNSPKFKRKPLQVGTYGSIEESNRYLFEDVPSVDPAQMSTYRKVKLHIEGVLDDL